MIDGLRVQMTTEELARRLNERIAWHRHAAAEFEAARRRSTRERQDPLATDYVLEHDMREHRDHAGVLEMLRDHLVPGEVYLLGELDLRFADLVPEFHLEPEPLRRPLEAAMRLEN